MSSNNANWDVSTAQNYARDVLTGERTRLRSIRDSDIASRVQWRQDSATEILQSSSLSLASEADLRRQFGAREPGAPSDRCAFAVESLPEPSEPSHLLGFVTLNGISAQHRSATFAIALDPSAGGHGYGTDATRLMVRYGFRELGLHRVQLEAWAFNERALRTYRKAGFVEEGRRRDAVFHDGRWHDEVLMGALASDPGWLDPID